VGRDLYTREGAGDSDEAARVEYEHLVRLDRDLDHVRPFSYPLTLAFQHRHKNLQECRHQHRHQHARTSTPISTPTSTLS
jgi:hypothetical protein